ncbi:MAG TPA: hypothetical protein VG347_24055 [Verrucomicrobiae bacterium]|nr:hypothetical protein [Verrucomicrobiae bacterium]
MPNIPNALFRFFLRLTTRASRGVVMYGTRQLTVQVIREIDVTIMGTRISYAALSDADKKAVDEIAKYLHRFGDQYVQHHDQYQQRRKANQTNMSFEDYLESHSDEIINAGMQAAAAHMRSAYYDSTVGKPKFLSQIFAKEYYNALVNHFSERVS